MASHLTTLVEIARSRILSQYQKMILTFVPLVAGLVGEVQTLEDAFWDFYEGLQLDNAEGDMLDRYGFILDEPRESIATDAEFRRHLKAKIVANGSAGTLPDFLTMLDELLETLGADVQIVELPPLAVEVTIDDLAFAYMGAPLERARRLLSKTRSTGVRVMLFTSTTGDETQDFSFFDGPGLGFDDSDAPGSGGAFTSAVAAPV